MSNTKTVSVGQLKRYMEIEDMAKKLTAEKNKIKAEILNQLEGQGLTNINYDDEGIVVNLAVSERRTLDTKALKEEKPDVYSVYSKLGEVKKLTVVKA